MRKNSLTFCKYLEWSWLSFVSLTNTINLFGSLPSPWGPITFQNKTIWGWCVHHVGICVQTKTTVFKIYNSSRGLCVPWGNLISPFSISTEGGLKKFPILCQRRVLDSNSGETSIGFFGCQQVLRAQFPLHHITLQQINIDWLHNNIVWYNKTLYYLRCYILSYYIMI